MNISEVLFSLFLQSAFRYIELSEPPKLQIFILYI